MELYKNAILLLLLLAANLVLVAKGEETEGGDKSFVEVCSSERGRMAVSPRYGTAQSQFRTCISHVEHSSKTLLRFIC